MKALPQKSATKPEFPKLFLYPCFVYSLGNCLATQPLLTPWGIHVCHEKSICFIIQNLERASIIWCLQCYQKTCVAWGLVTIIEEIKGNTTHGDEKVLLKKFSCDRYTYQLWSCFNTRYVFQHPTALQTLWTCTPSPITQTQLHVGGNNDAFLILYLRIWQLYSMSTRA